MFKVNKLDLEKILTYTKLELYFQLYWNLYNFHEMGIPIYVEDEIGKKWDRCITDGILKFCKYWCYVIDNTEVK